MSSYNFKKETSLYIVHAGNQYSVDISEINVSQTFTENSYAVKTLHSPSDMFEGSTINKANPANFDFKSYAIQEPDHSILVDLLVGNNGNLDSFDIYMETPTDVYSVTGCVVSSGTFIIEVNKLLAINISGQGVKLSREGDTGTFVIPGIVVPRATTTTYINPHSVNVLLDMVEVSGLYNISVELQNNVEWNKYTDIHKAIEVVDASTSMYPSEFTVTGRIFAGSFSQYLPTGVVPNLLEWSTDSTLRIRALTNTYGFDFDMDSVSFTNRMSTGSVYTCEYNWRLTDNSSDLSSIINYITE